MKTSNRIPKAIAVIVILGLGLVHNMENKHLILDPVEQLIVNGDKSQVKSDSPKRGENKVFYYTKSFIQKGIQHLISTI